jgi:acyl-coenzyme A thioesterase PaaI-like protein
VTEVPGVSDGDDRSVGSMGLSFAVDGDRVVATFTPRLEHRGAPGFLHGGFAAMALDETLAAVGWLLDGQHVVTATLELRYRRPVPLSAGPLRVEAWRVGRESARRWRVEGRLLLADGTVAVEGRGIFVAAPQSMRMAP